jgi:hypothetical protein
METGNIIKCMGMEGLNGLTEEFMKGNTTMTKSMAKGLSIGQMVANIWVDGIMANNMVMGNIF